MANDVNCWVHIDCNDEDKIHEIRAAVYDEETDNDFDFEKIVPLGKNDDPYEKWGTKWSRWECCYEDGDGLSYSFTTAWNAPYQLFQAFCKKFKVKARLEYYDFDDFGRNCGYMEVDENGEIEDEEYFDSAEEGGLDFIVETFGEDEVELRGWKKNENGEWFYSEDEE